MVNKRLNPIVFPVSEEIVTTYYNENTAPLFNTSLLNLDGDYLVLWVAPSEYQFSQDSPELIRGVSSDFVNLSGDKPQLQLSIKDGRPETRAILEELITQSHQGDTITPITLLDYNFGNPYLERRGIMWIEGITGSFSSSNRSLSQGFTLVFEEV